MFLKLFEELIPACPIPSVPFRCMYFVRANSDKAVDLGKIETEVQASLACNVSEIMVHSDSYE